MFNWYELLLYMLFTAIGASLMRWADLRVERAVARERSRTRQAHPQAMPAPSHILPTPIHTGPHAPDDLAPLPLQLDDRDAQALRRDGAVVKQRRRA